MDRVPMVDLPRLGSNRATERYQPHWGHGIDSTPLRDGRRREPVAIIRRGRLGVGASYEMGEPVGTDWHSAHGATPLVERAAGA